MFLTEGTQPQLTTVSETPERHTVEINSNINEEDSSFEEVEKE